MNDTSGTAGRTHDEAGDGPPGGGRTGAARQDHRRRGRVVGRRSLGRGVGHDDGPTPSRCSYATCRASSSSPADATDWALGARVGLLCGDVVDPAQDVRLSNCCLRSPATGSLSPGGPHSTRATAESGAGGRQLCSSGAVGCRLFAAMPTWVAQRCTHSVKNASRSPDCPLTMWST